MEENIESGWTTVFDSNMKMKLNHLAGIKVEHGEEVYIPQVSLLNVMGISQTL